MKHILTNLGLLFLYCFFNLFSARPNIFFVLAFLVALIICCTDCFLNLERVIAPLSFLYLFGTWLSPAFLCFAPAIAYVLFRRKKGPWLYINGAFYLYTFAANKLGLLPFCLGLFGILMAYQLNRFANSYIKLDTLYKHSQDDSRELNLLLTEKNQSLLEKQNYEIYTAKLKERNRIAREIHDNVGHLLSRSILIVGALKAVNPSQTIAEPIDTLDATLNSAMDSIRRSVHDLHDEAINLDETINGLVKDFTFCPIAFRYDMGRNIPKEVKYSFISITKEALSNIIKHSNASHVHIVMREHPALYQLCIEDNGTQFNSEDTGIGLLNMRERILSLKGNIQFLSENGFKIFITIPKET